MSVRSSGVFLLLLLVGSAYFARPLQAQQRSFLPSQESSTLQDLSTIPLRVMPSVNVEALRDADRKTDDRIGPLRYGTTIDTDLSPDRHGSWERLPSGSWMWRLRIRSQDAVSVSVAFTQFRLPPGARLFVYAPNQSVIRGPYTREDETAGQHWTPNVPGDELIVEVEVPQNRRSELGLTIGRVIHAYRSLDASRSDDGLAKAGTCNLDVACSEADPWRKQVHSVGRYTFEEGGSTFLCTGALVNNTNEDKTPYFLTAEHCISTEQNATSMVFYWNYQNPTCRTPGTFENGQVTQDSLSEQTSSGAILRARYGNIHDQGRIAGKPDLALVEIDDTIPDTYPLYLSGWSREGNGAQSSTTIHHPKGHGKRISFDEDPTSFVEYPSTGTCQAPSGNTHLNISAWDVGTTEVGSSGAPLFNQDHQIIGVLSGGCAGCGGDGDAEDNNEPDWYGRIAPGFTSGDYQGATLADFLDPTDSGADTLSGLALGDIGDVTPPSAITDLQITKVNTSDARVTLTWTATGDDRRQGTAAQYDLRYATSPITSFSDFRKASAVTGLPSPKSANEPESVTIGTSNGLKKDETYYFGLVARDDGGNVSNVAQPTRSAILATQIRIDKGGLLPGASGGTISLDFVVTQTQDVRVALYDVLGRQVGVLLDENVKEGFRQTLQHDTQALSSGPYFLRFQGETFTKTRKIMIVQ